MPPRIEIIDGKIWCPKCSQYKGIDDFYFFEGRPKRPCKECKIEYQTFYYVENKEDIEIYRQGYYQENREEIIAKQLERDSQRKDEIAIYQAVYRQDNKADLLAKKKEYRKARKTSDPAYRLRSLVSNTIYQALKYTGSSKGGASIIDFLPYSFQELKEHIEGQFEDWMSWENWGAYNPKTWDDTNPATWTWNIDHIIAQAKLPYTSMEDENFKKCWALENLRPLSSKQNIIKGNK